MNARSTTLLPLHCEIHRSVRALPQVEGYNSPKPHPDSAQLEGGGGRGGRWRLQLPPHSSPFCACWRPLNIPETLAQVEGYNSPSLIPILLKLKAAAPDSRESCSARASDSCDLSSMKTAVAETEFLGRENTEIYFSNWTVPNFIIPTFWPYFF